MRNSPVLGNSTLLRRTSVLAAAAIAAQEGYEAYNLLFNTGAEAGQTIFHTHLHLLAGGITALPV